MSVTVRKSSPIVVRPFKPVKIGSIIKLSIFDNHMIGVPVTVLLMFDQRIQEPAETMKRALSQALVHYYPIAGRLAAGADDAGLHICCSGDGVPLVAASASCPLTKVKFMDQSPGAKEVLDELAPHYDPAEYRNPSNPLMMMQVTEFSCGGFIVGVTWNHAIADGHGMAKFLQAVGESARGLSSPSIAPIRSDDSVPILTASHVATQHDVVSLEPLDLAFLDITIPSSAIDRIRSEYYSSSGGQSSCTMFEVVAAVLWRCRTRVIMSNPEAPAMLWFTANVRRHVGAKDSYYGNCVVGQPVMATSGTVANGNMNDVIKMIKQAKDLIPDKFKKDRVMESYQRQAMAPKLFDSEFRYSTLGLSSWRNIGFEEPDFGSGNPARVMFNRKPIAWPMPQCVCLPWKGLDAANVMSICVKKEHADAFIDELSRFT